MIESLLFNGGSSKKEFPNSGPGSKVLIAGDERLGYFGKVSDEDLFTPKEVLAKTGLTGGLNWVYNGGFWLKFIRNEKVIFIKDTFMYSGISWNTLYSFGLVYGVNGPGKYPASPPVNQFKYAIKNSPEKDWFLKFRLPDVTTVDPYVSANGGSEIPGSEWEDLIGRVIIGAHPNAGTWDKLIPGDLGIGTSSFDYTTATNSSNTAQTLVRGQGLSDGISVLKTATSSSHRYRPVLELIDPDGLVVEPLDVAGNGIDGVNPPDAFTVNNTGVIPTVVAEVNGTEILLVNPPTHLTASVSNPVLLVQQIESHFDIKLTTMKISEV